MGFLDKLFGRRPGGWGQIEDAAGGVGDAAGDLGRTLGGADPKVRICGRCGRPVRGRSPVCPVGHWVGRR
jgi:hypothetical protein